MKPFHPNLKDFDFLNGQLILIDKPLGWTSFDVVNKIRYKITNSIYKKKIKVGHAGTLDPLATGLLIICTGKFTKKIHEIQDKDKVYTGTFYLGASRPSFDRETEINENFSVDHLDITKIENATKSFIGKILQTPPLFSAIKIKGERAYKLARRDLDVKLKSREVEIKRFEITKIDLPYVEFEVHCTKGTYIRSLADDFGKALDSGAYLHDLRRTKIGTFDINNALTLDDFNNSVDKYSKLLES